MDLCVNYKAAEANWDADIAYFKRVGVKGIRPHMPAVDSPWIVGVDSAGSFAFWRRCAKYFSDRGFFVSWGIAGYNGFNGAGQMTATRWTEYRAIILAEAAYLQAQGINICFEIGNEMESTADGSTLTVAQMISNLGTLATDVKAIYTLGTVAYSPWDYLGTTYDTWISTGRGGLDFINVHPYCNSADGNRSLTYGGWTAINKMIRNFGPTHCNVTECGMEAGDTALQALPTYLKVAKWREQWNYMKNLGFQRAFVYTYVGYLNGDNQFAMKLTNSTFDPQWDVLISDGKRTRNVTRNPL
jgi:hypothetical protein